MFSRRGFLKASAAFAATLALHLSAQTNAEQPYAGLRKTLRTPEWPELTSAEQNILNICLLDESAKWLIDYKVNQCVYQNPNVKQALKAYQIGGKPIELKRSWEVDFVLGRFYIGVMKRAHDNNPNNAQLKIGEIWAAFLDHCSYHVLKDGIRYLGAAAQGLPLSGSFVLHPKQAALKTSVTFYETLMGNVEDWPVFNNMPFDLSKTNIWDEDKVEKIAAQLPRYDLLAMMKKLGVGMSLLKISPADLASAVPGSMPVNAAPAPK